MVYKILTLKLGYKVTESKGRKKLGISDTHPKKAGLVILEDWQSDFKERIISRERGKLYND